jgi:excisionase family DNA binding protein
MPGLPKGRAECLAENHRDGMASLVDRWWVHPMRIVERMHRMLDGMPEEGQITLPVCLLRAWLDDETIPEGTPTQATASPMPDPGLTVAQVAAHIGREESTIRGWVGEGRFPGAFKLGREWRIPREDLAQALNTGGGNEAGRAREPEITGRGDLAAWRKERAR